MFLGRVLWGRGGARKARTRILDCKILGGGRIHFARARRKNGDPAGPEEPLGRTRPRDGRDSVLCHELEGAGAACGGVCGTDGVLGRVLWAPHGGARGRTRILNYKILGGGRITSPEQKKTGSRRVGGAAGETRKPVWKGLGKVRFTKQERRRPLPSRCGMWGGIPWDLDGYAPLRQGEIALYRAIREAVPVVDAAVLKLVRLCGGLRPVCGDGRAQEELERFLRTVSTGRGQQGIQSFWTSIWTPC